MVFRTPRAQIHYGGQYSWPWGPADAGLGKTRFPERRMVESIVDTPGRACGSRATRRPVFGDTSVSSTATQGPKRFATDSGPPLLEILVRRASVGIPRGRPGHRCRRWVGGMEVWGRSALCTFVRKRCASALHLQNNRCERVRPNGQFLTTSICPALRPSPDTGLVSSSDSRRGELHFRTVGQSWSWQFWPLWNFWSIWATFELLANFGNF